MPNISSRSTVRVGIIGGGLMGREVASAFGRWFALTDVPVRAELTAVCDVQPAQLEWFRQVPTVTCLTPDHHELLARDDVDVVYVAVPHGLHEPLYLDVLRAGKDLFAEKPFGIDLAAARRIRDEAAQRHCFVRVSSEFPFLPGAQHALALARSGDLGCLLEIHCAFSHASDLDPAKPINWKRQVKTCGAAGVMNDLGLHVLHLPLRLGWKPATVYARLQNIIAERPDGRGGRAPCDTWDNAHLACTVAVDGRAVPLDLHLRRIGPGETNTWSIEILGTSGGVRFSTKEPKTLWRFSPSPHQHWQRTDLGFELPFPTITGAIFEPGFPDLLMQMWAAFLAERAGRLGDRFGCATPDEAVAQHEVWQAALASHHDQVVATL